ncbi:histidine phosphatase family protein [Humidisolicoccus flavus]|uniref:histidine phosphatase family protein n=1 Tax=Humidisolicoccus flavus TaxID=3111414 RepID=UPI00324A4B5E
MTMQITLVRHGQTDWNFARKMQGTSDIPLNDVGREQARVAGVRLRDEGIEGIVSSPLSRAAETADIIAAELGLTVEARYENLVERHYGKAEGLTHDDATERWGDKSNWPDAETWEALTERAVAAFDAAATASEHEHLGIVAHGTIIRAFAEYWTKAPAATIDNGFSITFDGAPGEWSVAHVKV